jgi:transposase
MAGGEGFGGRSAQALRSARVPGLRGGAPASGVHSVGERRRAPTVPIRASGLGAGTAAGDRQRAGVGTGTGADGGGTGTRIPVRSEERYAPTRWQGIDGSYCRACLEKQRRIDDLKAELKRVKDQLRREQRTAREGPFGSSTPSAKLAFKAGSAPERQARRGGGRPGHAGHGRRACETRDAQETASLSAPTRCPACGTRLRAQGWRLRTVLDVHPVRMVRRLFRLQCKRCPKCGRRVQAQPPGVLPKSLYGNRLLAHVAVAHYVHGVTLGRLERETGVGFGGLVQAMHGLARRLEPALAKLLDEYRRAPVKHADETGWRNDGRNGYAWLFATTGISLFRFRQTRSAQVVHEVLGSRRLPGVLVVDRYGAYNQAPCRLQYCYAHLLRDVEDLEREFPENPEICAFVESFAPLLRQAMHLRTLRLSRGRFRAEARHLRAKIERVAKTSARHPAIQNIQDIFREKADRIYAWTKNPAIPAENNLAERELRPLVIARKISFGSQSEAGAKTRETLMSILCTLRRRTPDIHLALVRALDHLALHPAADTHALLFRSNTS